MNIKTKQTLTEIQYILSKTNRTGNFKATTLSLSKLLKLSPQTTRKYIKLLEEQNFLIYTSKAKPTGKGLWTKNEFKIPNPITIENCKQKVIHQKTSICENCTKQHFKGYFNDVVNGIKVKCKSYHCLDCRNEVTGITDCKDFVRKLSN